MMTYSDIVRQIPHLTVEERTRLIRVIIDTLLEGAAPKKRSVLEFEGVAARLANEEDPQEHVKRLRREWDDRP